MTDEVLQTYFDLLRERQALNQRITEARHKALAALGGDESLLNVALLDAGLGAEIRRPHEPSLAAQVRRRALNFL